MTSSKEKTEKFLRDLKKNEQATLRRITTSA